MCLAFSSPEDANVFAQALYDPDASVEDDSFDERWCHASSATAGAVCPDEDDYDLYVDYFKSQWHWTVIPYPWEGSFGVTVEFPRSDLPEVMRRLSTATAKGN